MLLRNQVFGVKSSVRKQYIKFFNNIEFYNNIIQHYQKITSLHNSPLPSSTTTIRTRSNHTKYNFVLQLPNNNNNSRSKTKNILPHLMYFVRYVIRSFSRTRTLSHRQKNILGSLIPTINAISRHNSRSISIISCQHFV
jgi:hypothetical protein